MGKTILVLAVLIFMLGCATTDSRTNSECWKCTANGLVKSKYTGGEYAYIHLRSFKDENDYKV